jgi:hypothetical protein
MGVDQECDLYIAEVGKGFAEKLRLRPGANPVLPVVKPAYAAGK